MLARKHIRCVSLCRPRSEKYEMSYRVSVRTKYLLKSEESFVVEN